MPGYLPTFLHMVGCSPDSGVRKKGLPSLGKETEILHSKSTAYIDLSGIVLLLSNLSSLVQSEIRALHT